MRCLVLLCLVCDSAAVTWVDGVTTRARLQPLDLSRVLGTVQWAHIRLHLLGVLLPVGWVRALHCYVREHTVRTLHQLDGLYGSCEALV